MTANIDASAAISPELTGPAGLDTGVSVDTDGYWLLLILLVSVNVLHTADRQIISALLEPLRQEFHLTDSALGILSGIAYAGAAVLAAIPAGVLADKFSRKGVLIAAFTLWSGFSAACGLATGHLTLLLARIGVGATAAAGPPCCLSMIADAVPEHRRATALGIFYGSSALGGLFAFSLGAWIAAHWGWQAAFFTAAAPALVLSPLMMRFLAEPARSASLAKAKNAPVRDAITAIIRNGQLALVIVASTIASLPGGGVYVWVTSLLVREHGLNLARAGLVVALVAGFIMPISMFLGGRLSDKLVSRSAGAPMFLASATCVGAALLGVVLAFSPTTGGAIAALCFHGFFVVIYVAPSIAAIMRLSPAGPRTTLLAMVTVLNLLAATGLGPIVMGFISDLVGGSRSLSAAIAIISLISLVPGLLYALLGRQIASSARR